MDSVNFDVITKPQKLTSLTAAVVHVLAAVVAVTAASAAVGGRVLL